MICWHKLYHFTVANTRFTAPLTRRVKTKFATIKWYNLCQQIIQSQTCYPLPANSINFSCWKTCHGNSITDILIFLFLIPPNSIPVVHCIVNHWNHLVSEQHWVLSKHYKNMIVFPFDASLGSHAPDKSWTTVNLCFSWINMYICFLNKFPGV